jgi:acetamidase/formamidase
VATIEQRKVGRVHVIDDAHHWRWDNSLKPAKEVESGDVLVFVCREPADGQFTPASTVATLKKLDFDRIHSLSGPVSIAGAKPGDALSIEILDFKHEGWAWTMIYPGLGLLQKDFGETMALRIWKVGSDGRASFRPGVRVPVEPFCGVMGVAPEEPGAHITLPPRRTGGNMDIRHLCKGTTLQLPIEVPGGLFSLGDCHLAQGDGEVCGTALEAPMTVTVRLTLLKDLSLSAPCYTTSGPTTSKVDGMGHYAKTAIGLDLQQCAEEAVRSMVDFLQSEYGLSREDAYVVCSAAGDLKIPVPVLGDGHRGVVSFHVPRSIFVDQPSAQP